MNKMDSQRKKYWLTVLFCTLSIYATIPIARPIGTFLRKQGVLNLLVNLSTSAFFVIFLIFLTKKHIRNFGTYFLAVLWIFVYYAALGTIHIPEEKVHFIEYSALSLLIFRALRLDHPEGKSYFFTLILTGFLGWIDEGIQYLTPGRYYDLRDVAFNFCGGVLGLFILLIVNRETHRNKSTGENPKNP